MSAHALLLQIPTSYQAAAEIAINRLGRIDVLVATVGSGGSSAGLARVLRKVNPALRVIGVDTFGSVLFGLPVGPRALRGLGNSLMPGNIDHTVYNAVQWVTEDIALEGALRIEEAGLGEHGLTSGAAWMVAQHLSMAEPEAVILAVFPDLGWRYRAALAAYRLRRNFVLASLPEVPGRSRRWNSSANHGRRSTGDAARSTLYARKLRDDETKD